MEGPGCPGCVPIGRGCKDRAGLSSSMQWHIIANCHLLHRERERVMREDHPPSVRLVIRVGITGHRRRQLLDLKYNDTELRKSVALVLEHIRGTAERVSQRRSSPFRGPWSVRLLSPLADGSDQIVADEADKLGYELQCPLPYSWQDCEKDFTDPDSPDPDSLRDFRRLLKKATAVLELPGKRKVSESYLAVGKVVLQQCDILIAIWDGQPASKIGGTAQITGEALRNQIPIVWIDARPPHRILRAGSDPTNPVELKSPEVSQQLETSLGSMSPKEEQKYLRFLDEKQPEWKLAAWFWLFCKSFVWNWKRPTFRITPFRVRDCGEWVDKWRNPPEKLSGKNIHVGGQAEASYRPYFAWADGLAEILADRYRSSFVANYLMGACAVIFAFIGFHNSHLGQTAHGWYVAELILIFVILGFFWMDRNYYWHQRWIDYRLLAEGFRQMESLFPFGQVPPSFEPPLFLEGGQNDGTWFKWYFRSVVRQADLLRARIDEVYIEDSRQVLAKCISSQVRYHAKSKSRFHRLSHHLHWLALALFTFTTVACGLHFLPWKAWSPNYYHTIEAILTGMAIGLPAFGAAIEGIVHQGEFRQIAKRSQGIHDNLQSLLRDVEDDKKQLSYQQLGQIANRFCTSQSEEQAHWRSLFSGKPIPLT